MAGFASRRQRTQTEQCRMPLTKKQQKAFRELPHRMTSMVTAEPCLVAEPEYSSPTIPDSDCQTSFASGAVRDGEAGKGFPSGIPIRALRSLARRFEDGAKKYGRHNWFQGIPLSRFYDAILRHAISAHEGDTSEDHLGAVMWNASCWAETEARIDNGELPGELDDLTFRPDAPRP